jgi:tetratricopeptide (TPR) repeat protein
MANASRRLDDYQAAHRLFALSRSILQSEGVTDLLVYAEIDSAEAVLHLDQRRFREAEELLNQSVVLYSVAGARELSVHPLITLGLLEYTRGDFMKAIEATEFAAEFLDPERDLQLFVCARFNLALFLFESGQFRAATDALGAARKTIEQLPDTYTRLRIIWLEAKIAAALQRFEEAESALRIARDGFVEQRNGYDAALASLDLALLLMRQGRTDEVRQIAEEILPIFVTDEVDREALATLTLLADAAQQTTLAIELVEELIGRVERLRPSRSRCL